ncbi:MAG TPA: hypothetical protein VEG60_06985 [Candidatus Binatia bacterium]|nr:hypothetical protein [Candidatus Binatia bacterium]
MEYQAAWEAAIREWTFLPEGPDLAPHDEAGPGESPGPDEGPEGAESAACRHGRRSPCNFAERSRRYRLAAHGSVTGRTARQLQKELVSLPTAIPKAAPGKQPIAA